MPINVCVFLLLTASACFQQVSCVDSSVYGNTCNCDGVVCGITGSRSKNDTCWYNCCWHTMSKVLRLYHFDNLILKAEII